MTDTDHPDETLEQLDELARNVKAGQAPKKDPHPFRQAAFDAGRAHARTRPDAPRRIPLVDDGTPPPQGIDPRDVESSPDRFRYDTETTIDPKRIAPSHFRVDLDENGQPHHSIEKIVKVSGAPKRAKVHYIDPAKVAAAKTRPLRSRGT